METATLAGGCFWCTQALFKRLKGVHEVVSGYGGGEMNNPSYEDVSSGRSRHTETIQIKFDPKIIAFAKILEVFRHLIDPTTLNRQGADAGTQYRSVIFYHNDTQRKIAEDCHQNYYERNSHQPYCQLVIDPKIQKLTTEFKGDVKK